MATVTPAAMTALRFAPQANTREALQRMHVLQQLQPDARGSVRLVLLCAPAGFGKSTLLAQLAQAAQQAGSTVAWLNCDARDQDPAVFAENISAAFRHGLVSGAATGLPAALELAEVAAPLLICIDDYERACGADTDALVEQMALLASPQVHIVVAGREQPRRALTRLLLSGHARQVEAELLRFTPLETERLLQADLGAPALAQVAEYASGWPFALQLARLRARAVTAAPAWPGDGVRTDIPRRQIFDYLAQEVLDTLPTPLRDFLTDVAVLDVIDVPSANALRERADSLALVQQLTRIRPIAVVDEATWSVRLHPLLRDYLCDACDQQQPGRIHTLHRRAARHLAERTQLHEAVAHAVAGQDLGLGADLLEAAGGFVLIAGEGAVRSRLLLQQLPAATLQARPRLRLLQLVVQLLEGDPANVPAEFERVEHVILSANAAPDDPVHLDLALARAAMLLARGERELYFAPWAVLEQVRALARTKSLADRRPMALNLSFEIYFLHRYGPAERCERRVHEVERLYQDGAYTYNSPWIWIYRARNALARGDLALAESTLRESLACDLNFVQFRQGSLARLSASLLGQLAYARGEVERALEHFAALMPLDPRHTLEAQHGASVGMALCEFALGHAERAMQLLETARHLAFEEALPHLALLSAAVQVDLLLRWGHVEHARALANAIGLDAQAGAAREVFALPWAETLALARACWRLQLAQGQAQQAADVAQALLAQARQTGQALGELDAHCMLACAHAALGDAAAARLALEAALALGARSGAVQQVQDIGPELLALVREWLAAARPGAEPARQAFAQQLVQLWESRFGQRIADNGLQLMTPRESDVLRELARDHSTKQIARDLLLSPETVKHHLKSIFAKLGVRTREDALLEARRRALIP